MAPWVVLILTQFMLGCCESQISCNRLASLAKMALRWVFRSSTTLSRSWQKRWKFAGSAARKRARMNLADRVLDSTREGEGGHSRLGAFLVL